jgi:glucose-6-phosphate 1-dehydrogenase
MDRPKSRPMVSRVIPVELFDLVVFGATGDLAQRKILPALLRRFVAGQVPEGSRLIGAARSEHSVAEYRAFAEAALAEHAAGVGTAEQRKAFIETLDYVTVDATGAQGWPELATKLVAGRVRAFYFSVAPRLFGALAERLHKYGMASGDARIVVEKPFGRDLATAEALNRDLAQHFAERQIYRIDHYLGKETVQNLMAIRFGNMLFEPLWNA